MAIIPALVISITLPARQALRYYNSFSFSRLLMATAEELSPGPFAAIRFVSYAIAYNISQYRYLSCSSPSCVSWIACRSSKSQIRVRFPQGEISKGYRVRCLRFNKLVFRYGRPSRALIPYSKISIAGHYHLNAHL